MENAVEALKMGFGVLVFIVALSVSMNAFAEARRASDAILSYSDRDERLYLCT